MPKQATTRIDSYCDIATGVALRGRAPIAPTGHYRLLVQGDMPSSAIFGLGGLPACMIEAPQKRTLLHPGDLIFLGRGDPRCAVYRDEPAKVIFAAPLLRLRILREDILPEFLALHLRSDPMRAILRHLMRGSVAKFVSRDDLAAVECPLPPLSRQQAILEFDHLAIKEAELSKRLQLLRTQTTNALLATSTPAAKS